MLKKSVILYHIPLESFKSILESEITISDPRFSAINPEIQCQSYKNVPTLLKLGTVESFISFGCEWL
jgi:hypothetical protein